MGAQDSSVYQSIRTNEIKSRLMDIFTEGLVQHLEAHDTISMAKRMKKPLKMILLDSTTLI